MSVVRTPKDEIDKPGYFYPPFIENWWYEGITYGGHSDFSVDWNRRSKTGAWLNDEGDPVLAAADGTVTEVDIPNGAVMVNHWGGLWRTEYRHMSPVGVKVGDKVQRGDRVGDIGKVGITTAVPSPHLHHVHWKRTDLSKPFERTKQSFYGDAVRTSVYNSDSKPKGWDAPEAVMIQGPPPKATWESAFTELEKKYTKVDAIVVRLREQIAQTPATDEVLKAQLSDLQVEFDNLGVKYDALTAKWNSVGVAVDNLVDVYGE